jgi:hypothetical protein
VPGIAKLKINYSQPSLCPNKPYLATWKHIKFMLDVFSALEDFQLTFDRCKFRDLSWSVSNTANNQLKSGQNMLAGPWLVKIGCSTSRRTTAIQCIMNCKGIEVSSTEQAASLHSLHVCRVAQFYAWRKTIEEETQIACTQSQPQGHLGLILQFKLLPLLLELGFLNSMLWSWRIVRLSVWE